VEVISQFSVADLVVLVTLAGVVLFGFQQGLLRYLLNTIVVLVAFVVASQLKGLLADWVNSFWEASTPEQQELWIFVALWAAGVIGGFVGVRLFYQHTRLPIPRLADEILGAAMAVVWLALVYTFSMVVLDTYFLAAGESASGGPLASLYEFLNQSVIVGWFRDLVLPAAGFVVGPFVPAQVQQYL